MARATREYLSPCSGASMTAAAHEEPMRPPCSGASMTAEAHKPPLQRISFASALTERRHNASQMLGAKSASESGARITTN